MEVKKKWYSGFCPTCNEETAWRASDSGDGKHITLWCMSCGECMGHKEVKPDD